MKLRVMGLPSTFSGSDDRIQLFLHKKRNTINCSYRLVSRSGYSDIVSFKKRNLSH